MLETVAMDTILFLCTGNTCRSPMAEAIAQHWLDQGHLGEDRRYLAASAGVVAVGGSPVSEETSAVLTRLGIAHDGRSKLLTAEMISNASAVLCMTAAHVASASALLADQPEEQRKVALLDPGNDIEDPIDMGQGAYDALAQRLMDVIPKRLKEVLSDEDRAGIRSSRR